MRKHFMKIGNIGRIIILSSFLLILLGGIIIDNGNSNSFGSLFNPISSSMNLNDEHELDSNNNDFDSISIYYDYTIPYYDYHTLEGQEILTISNENNETVYIFGGISYEGYPNNGKLIFLKYFKENISNNDYFELEREFLWEDQIISSAKYCIYNVEKAILHGDKIVLAVSWKELDENLYLLNSKVYIFVMDLDFNNLEIYEMTLYASYSEFIDMVPSGVNNTGLTVLVSEFDINMNAIIDRKTAIYEFELSLSSVYFDYDLYYIVNNLAPEHSDMDSINPILINVINKTDFIIAYEKPENLMNSTLKLMSFKKSVDYSNPIPVVSGYVTGFVYYKYENQQIADGMLSTNENQIIICTLNIEKSFYNIHAYNNLLLDSWSYTSQTTNVSGDFILTKIKDIGLSQFADGSLIVYSTLLLSYSSGSKYYHDIVSNSEYGKGFFIDTYSPYNKFVSRYTFLGIRESHEDDEDKIMSEIIELNNVIPTKSNDMLITGFMTYSIRDAYIPYAATPLFFGVLSSNNFQNNNMNSSSMKVLFITLGILIGGAGIVQLLTFLIRKEII